MQIKGNYGSRQPGATPFYDPTRPGYGADSDLITDTTTHLGAWFCLKALAAAVVDVITDSIKTTNGVAPSTVATAAVAGQTYKILTVGTTDWTAIGASVNAVGVTFLATGAGTGNGTATSESRPITGISIPAGAEIYGAFQSIRCQSGSLLAYRG